MLLADCAVALLGGTGAVDAHQFGSGSVAWRDDLLVDWEEVYVGGGGLHLLAHLGSGRVEQLLRPCPNPHFLGK